MASTSAKRSGGDVTVIFTQAKPTGVMHFHLKESPSEASFKEALRNPGMPIVIKLISGRRLLRIDFTLGTSHKGHEPIGVTYTFHGTGLWTLKDRKDWRVLTTMTFKRNGQLLSILQWPDGTTIPPRLARRSC